MFRYITIRGDRHFVVEELTMVVDRCATAFRCIVAGAISVLALFAHGAAAQTQQQVDWCVNSDGLFSYDMQISGCTAVIQFGLGATLDLPWAFHKRAYAYYKKDEYQNAIEDFSELLRLDPTDAHALNGRCWMRTESRSAILWCESTSPPGLGSQCGSTLRCTPDHWGPTPQTNQLVRQFRQRIRVTREPLRWKFFYTKHPTA